VDEDPVLEPHANGSRQHYVDLESADKQRAHGPLVPVEWIVRGRPCSKEGPQEPAQVLPEWLAVWSVEADPEAVAVSGRRVGSETGEHEAYKGCDHGRQHQPWWTAESAAGDRHKRCRHIVVLIGELQRLIGTDEACQEGEDGHADAALVWDSQVGQL